MKEEIGRLIEDIRQEQNQRRVMELQLLQEQINPHFLYNTLESINWRAKAAGNREISLMTESLGAFLRAALSNKKSLVTLSYELNLIQCYITIQQIRFEERLDYRTQIPEHVKDALIPPLTLQPLVENSIHYALEEIMETCYITIMAEAIPEDACDSTPRLRILVKNSGSAFDKRIKLLFGDAYGLSLYNEEDCAVAAIIIPYCTEEPVSC